MSTFEKYKPIQNLIWDTTLHTEPFYFLNEVGNSKGMTITFSLNPALLNETKQLALTNKYLLDLFVHQRKIHRYYKACTELEEENISEQEFNSIESSCVINLKNESVDEVIKKIQYLYKELKDNYPEELEHLELNDLADLMQISAAKLNLYLKPNYVQD